jgi:hypothetical protein
VSGVPVTFVRNKQEKEKVNDEEWAEGNETLREEMRLPDEDSKRVEDEIQAAIKRNQALPVNTMCDLPGSEFRIKLRSEEPAYTRQYPIPERLKEKVSKRVGEWVEKGWVKKKPKRRTHGTARCWQHQRYPDVWCQRKTSDCDWMCRL